jgi:hypothetical protein
MTKKGEKKNKPSMRIAGASEVEMPKNDALNIWDSEFGWILRYGKPTENTKAYWARMRIKPKQ